MIIIKKKCDEIRNLMDKFFSYTVSSKIKWCEKQLETLEKETEEYLLVLKLWEDLTSEYFKLGQFYFCTSKIFDKDYFAEIEQKF